MSAQKPFSSKREVLRKTPFEHHQLHIKQCDQQYKTKNARKVGCNYLYTWRSALHVKKPFPREKKVFIS